ncbi:LacI family DNA-binding transcriptional regulator [Geminisphaera colitermitum]|uniref:LacI family DNA-binding transcriptional regulator n=1 Tax=Geminisphaera colitermitum TaxID=1148786 RepID=UPI0001964E97|nr:LacI family DNA-binding transcriptional regulator [Geminisphaera colitermitum]
MTEIARVAGVSVSAVSSFLNNRNYGIRVSEGTQQRITAACRKLHYQPKSQAARARIYPQLGDVCFMVNNRTPDGAQNHYFGRMLGGVMKAMKQSEQQVTYALFDLGIDYMQHPERLPLPVRQESATKFILASGPNPSLVQHLLESGRPFVYLGQHLEMPGFLSICPDYAEASRMAVHHLHGMGHRNIAFITGSFGNTRYNQTEIERGFAQGMREVGLTLKPHLLCHGKLNTTDVSAAVDYCMGQPKAGERPTAFFCFHDTAAICAAGRLQARGVRVPDEVSVMGLNDEAGAATSHPAMTTVHFPLEEMGRAGLAEVERQALEGRPAASRKIVLPVTLIERASCAAVT